MDIESMQQKCQRGILRVDLAALSLLTPLTLAGCSHAPEYAIFGSFFPVWIFCAAGGLLLMMGVRVAIARTVLAEYVAAPVLLYLSIATFMACVLWLLLYS